MRWRIVNLESEYDGRIDSFSDARNSFIKQLRRHEYVLFLANDEEAPFMLRKLIDRLTPTYPYYWIRRVNLLQNRWMPAWNPEYSPQLVSNKVRFFGKVHERVTPHRPHGTIDIPIIHNQPDISASYRNKWYQNTMIYNRFWLATKKIIEVARGR